MSAEACEMELFKVALFVVVWVLVVVVVLVLVLVLVLECKVLVVQRAC